MDEFNNVKQVMSDATNGDIKKKQFYGTGVKCEVKDEVK